MRIRPFDVTTAPPEDLSALGDFLNQIRAEDWPEDPPIPLEERIRRWRNVPSHVVFRQWVIRDDESVAAYAVSQYQQVEHNRHVANFHISVLPALRRRGLARRLLSPVVEFSRSAGRSLLISFTASTMPAGEAFLRRLGAQMGLPVHTNQLDIQELNRDLVRRWQERAVERASGFELLEWIDGVPDEQLEAFAFLIGAMNQAPRGDLRLEDFHVTPAQLKEGQETEKIRGDQRWRLVARERDTGRFAGYTEVIWHPNRPELLAQGDTVVLAAFQNRGLGRWLKAAMLEKILRDRPEVRRIRTGNAFQNAPMLKINYELGFRPYRSEFIWQVDTDAVEAYLLGKAVREESAHAQTADIQKEES